MITTIQLELICEGCLSIPTDPCHSFEHKICATQLLEWRTNQNPVQHVHDTIVHSSWVGAEGNPSLKETWEGITDHEFSADKKPNFKKKQISALVEKESNITRKNDNK